MADVTVEDLQAQVTSLTGLLDQAEQRNRLLVDTVAELAVENRGLKQIAMPVIQAQQARRADEGVPGAATPQG